MKDFISRFKSQIYDDPIMEKVYLVISVWSYSEEDHDIHVVRVFRSKDDADKFCSSLIDFNEDYSYSFYVESYEVF